MAAGASSRIVLIRADHGVSASTGCLGSFPVLLTGAGSLPGKITVQGGAQRVGAEIYVTSCDLGIFVDQAAEPVSPQDSDRT